MRVNRSLSARLSTWGRRPEIGAMKAQALSPTEEVPRLYARALRQPLRAIQLFRPGRGNRHPGVSKCPAVIGDRPAGSERPGARPRGRWFPGRCCPLRMPFQTRIREWLDPPAGSRVKANDGRPSWPGELIAHPRSVCSDGVLDRLRELSVASTRGSGSQSGTIGQPLPQQLTRQRGVGKAELQESANAKPRALTIGIPGAGATAGQSPSTSAMGHCRGRRMPLRHRTQRGSVVRCQVGSAVPLEPCFQFALASEILTSRPPR